MGLVGFAGKFAQGGDGATADLAIGIVGQFPQSLAALVLAGEYSGHSHGAETLVTGWELALGEPALLRMGVDLEDDVTAVASLLGREFFESVPVCVKGNLLEVIASECLDGGVGACKELCHYLFEVGMSAFQQLLRCG